MDLANRLQRRKCTIYLTLFFAVWFILQRTVFNVFGEEIAIWWFYLEYPPRLSPGLFLSAISHKLNTLTHIVSNTTLLLLIGGFGEPYLERNEIILIVIGLGYFGILLANVVTIFFGEGMWVLAGASSGILALLSYTGLQMKDIVLQSGSREALFSYTSIERLVTLFFLCGIPGILLGEILINTPTNSSHVIGILLGVGYYLTYNRQFAEISVERYR